MQADSIQALEEVILRNQETGAEPQDRVFEAAARLLRGKRHRVEECELMDAYAYTSMTLQLPLRETFDQAFTYFKGRFKDSTYCQRIFGIILSMLEETRAKAKQFFTQQHAEDLENT
jgi:hypothetical protein